MSLSAAALIDASAAGAIASLLLSARRGGLGCGASRLIQRNEARREDASGFVTTAQPRDPVDPDETLPRGQEYATVGHLYRGIEQVGEAERRRRIARVRKSWRVSPERTNSP